MKMTLFLLASAVALLAGPAVANPVSKRREQSENLNRIFDEIGNYTNSLTKGFVDDVEDLATPKCGNKFYCKVNQILHDHEKSHKNHHAEKIMKNMRQYLSSINCEEELKEVKTDVKKPIIDVMEHLRKCIQHRNLMQ